jgi:photosystem II stability/assembly factor-like uncharacterized protein
LTPEPRLSDRYRQRLADWSRTRVNPTRCPRLRIAVSARWTRRISVDKRVLSLALVVVLWPCSANSHDPSSWGGLFRSRDHGATWISANQRLFVGGALALAISPTDVNHLLLGTDSGLLRSRNGGRDWTLEAPSVLVGAVLAVAFAADGQRTLASTSLGIFRSETENSWHGVSAPRGAAPARVIVHGASAGRVYLAGWTGLSRSDDWGRSWSSITNGLPDEPTTALLVVPGSPETLCAIVGGRIWASDDGARIWTSRGAEILTGIVDALGLDATKSARLWAIGANGLFRSDDGGGRWKAVGRRLPEPNATARGITATDDAVVVTTDRGLYRSIDGGSHWELVIENLPFHLEAGPLVRDPIDPATLYAGFALVAYRELWSRAAERESVLARVGHTGRVGGAVFLVLVILGALATLRWLGHYPSLGSSMPAPRTRRDRGIDETRR